MNQIFSFKRWRQLMMRHWMENSKFFLYGTLSLLGAITISFIFFLMSNHRYTQYSFLVLYIIGLFLIGAIFASGAFDMLNKKERGIAYLTLPASHFEKLLTQIIYNLIFFTLVYSLCFYVMTELFEQVIQSRVAAEPAKYSYDLMDWENPQGIMEALNFILIMFFGVQALFMAGSIYFKRFAFLLTTIVLVIFILLLGYYLNKLKDTLLPGYYGNTYLISTSDLPRKIYRLPEALTIVLKWLMLLGWAPLFWLVSWFRLREKEI